MNECNYDPEIEDLLADLDVLSNLDDRIKKYPELVAKIKEFIDPKDLEETIKLIARVVRRHLGME